MKKTLTLGMTLAAMGGLAETIEIKAECAGMSAFRKFWDMPLAVAEDGARQCTDGIVTEWGWKAIWDGETVGPLAFDAVNRMLLVRFPGAAEAIAEKLKEGYVIEKAEVALPHLDEELWAMGETDYCGWDGYCVRANWNCDVKWRARRPNWHAIAYPLRKPWKADGEIGPTLNAAVNGAVYWKRWGATDVKEDRFDVQFGPAEVSSFNPNGRMSVTPLLTDKEFGTTLSERLRLISECGLIVSKWEVYDHRFYDNSTYEYSTATGLRAIVIREPSLIVTFREAERLKGETAERVEVKPPADIEAMVAAVKRGGRPQGKPTAVVASPEQVRAWNEAFMAKRPWMEAWQYEHTRELLGLDGSSSRPFYYHLVPDYYPQRLARIMKGENPEVTQAEIDYAWYLLWIDWMMAKSPRMWDGHLTADNMIVLWYDFRDAMPGPARDLFLKNCWA
ncbi:MAG: hypothetical protein FWF84_08115 [Kiritimatiellaeota bacterium]|nr:hypothetical protein [Kiritimatiellota bacterium]